MHSRKVVTAHEAQLTKTDKYFRVWALVLPISSILVVPFIQGTTPAYLFALAILLPTINVLILPPRQTSQYYVDLFRIIAVFVTISAIAQLGLSFSEYRQFKYMHLLDPRDDTIVLRRSFYTQSLYLLAAASTFVFIRRCYKPSWDRYLMMGALFLALYGIYEVSFFAVFRQSGDFLSNRMFGSFTGSWFQLMNIGPLVMQRLKSLTGEPSMYALTMLPFWIYATHTGRRRTSLILLVSLLLTTSTTALVGMCLYLAVRIVWFRRFDWVVVIGLAAIAAIAFLALMGNEFVLALLNKVIFSKFNLQSTSGFERLNSLMAGIRVFENAPIVNKLFGLGFGYTRSTNMFSTLLVNVGAVGLLLTFLIFLLPIARLGSSERELGIKAALVVTMSILMISVPEFSYLSTWLFLALGYNAMDQQPAVRARRQEMTRRVELSLAEER